MLKAVVVVAGAGLTIASTMVGAYRLHLLMQRHAPGIAALIPRDGFVLAGLLTGVAAVASWFI